MKVLYNLIIFAILPAYYVSSSRLEDIMTTKAFDPVADREFLNQVIVRMYRGTVRNGFRVLEFIEKFPKPEQRITGYRLLFDEMVKHKDLYTPELMTLAWLVSVSFKEENLANTDIIAIREGLPQSVLNFPWNITIRIKSKKYDNCMYTPYNAYVKDADNRYAFFWINPDDGDCYFKIKPSTDDVTGIPGLQLWSVKREEPLYAAGSDMLYDNLRRSVFFWRTGSFSKIGGDLWMFEPIENSTDFKIFNIFYKEYLYAAPEQFNFNIERRRAFTWRKSGCEGDHCEFKIVSNY